MTPIEQKRLRIYSYLQPYETLGAIRLIYDFPKPTQGEISLNLVGSPHIAQLAAKTSLRAVFVASSVDLRNGIRDECGDTE